MKKSKKTCVVIAMIMLLCVGLDCSWASEQVVMVSLSSQMAEAFGREAIESFMKESGNSVKIHVSSSGVCIERLRRGSSGMAGSTRRLSQEEKESGLVEIPICRDPMAVIVNKSCRVQKLTLQQLNDIFTKKITNWNKVGGADLPIVVIIPEKNYGAYKNFVQLFMRSEDIQEDFIASEAFKVVTGVRGIEGSISFIANSIAKNTAGKDASIDSVNVVQIDGRLPGHSSYPFQQVFSIVIKNENNQVVRDALNFMLSARVKKKIISRGMSPIPFKGPKLWAR